MGGIRNVNNRPGNIGNPPFNIFPNLCNGSVPDIFEFFLEQNIDCCTLQLHITGNIFFLGNGINPAFDLCHNFIRSLNGGAYRHGNTDPEGIRFNLGKRIHTHCQTEKDRDKEENQYPDNRLCRLSQRIFHQHYVGLDQLVAS